VRARRSGRCVIRCALYSFPTMHPERDEDRSSSASFATTRRVFLRACCIALGTHPKQRLPCPFHLNRTEFERIRRRRFSPPIDDDANIRITAAICHFRRMRQFRAETPIWTRRPCSPWCRGIEPMTP